MMDANVEDVFGLLIVGVVIEYIVLIGMAITGRESEPRELSDPGLPSTELAQDYS